MRKSISIIAALLLGLTVSTAVLAEEEATPVTEKKQLTEKMYLYHNYVPGMMGSQDSLVIDNNGNLIPIFESEGRRIEEVYKCDLDDDNKDEYLVQMDCGGSSGLRDMSLLKEKEENMFVPIWEDSYAAPSVRVFGRDGRKFVYIKYYVNPKEEKGIKALAVLTLDKDGKVDVRDSGKKKE